MWTIALQSNLVPGQTFHEKFSHLAAWGVEGIEVSGAELLTQADDLRRAAEAFPVRVTSACAGFHGWLVDRNPRSRLLAIAEIKEMLAVGAELGIAGLISPAAYGIASRVLPPSRHAYSIEEEQQLLIESLSEIAESASQTGGTLLLEPLNRYVDRVLNTVAEGVAVLEAVASPHIKLVPDTFHMNIEEATLAESLQAHCRVIGHVHLSDSNRGLPGLGHIDFVAVFAALHASGYEGDFAIECMLPPDPREALPRSLSFLQEAVASARTLS